MIRVGVAQLPNQICSWGVPLNRSPYFQVHFQTKPWKMPRCSSRECRALVRENAALGLCELQTLIIPTQKWNYGPLVCMPCRQTDRWPRYGWLYGTRWYTIAILENLLVILNLIFQTLRRCKWSAYKYWQFYWADGGNLAREMAGSYSRVQWF